MKQRRRIWWWLAGFAALMMVAMAYQHLAPRWALKAYKARLRARGVPLTWEECTPALVPEQVSAANRFIAAAQSRPNWGPALPSRLPGSMQMVGPGRAKAGWRQPHVGYPPTPRNAQTWRLMVERYGLAAVGASATEDTPTEDALRPSTWDDLKSALEIQESLLQEIAEASRAEAFNWNLDYSQGFFLLLPHLAPCKGAIESLRAATQVTVREGRLEEATSWMETQLRLVRNMEQEGLLINELVRIAMAAMAWDGTWEMLQTEGFTDAQLARLQKGWEDVHAVEGMIHALRLERASALIEYERCRKSPRYMVSVFSVTGAGGLFRGGPASSADNFIEAAIEWLKQLFHPRDGRLACVGWGWFDAYEDEQCYIEVIQTTMDDAERRLKLVAEQPVPATALAPGEPWQLPITSRFESTPKRHLFAGTVLPPLKTAMSRAFRVQMQREMALAAIALKRYRMRHGDHPETLEALVPEFLSAVPMDWMDGRPLRYRRLEAGRFLLYSVNEDQTDDGGDPSSAKPGSQSHAPYHARDFVWPEEVVN